MAYDMRLIEDGGFTVGDGTKEAWGQFHDLSKSGIAHLYIGDEAPLLLGGETGEYASLGNRDGVVQWGANSDDFTNERKPFWHPRYVPACYPKGTERFFLMTYEITQAQYVAFLNTLTFEQQVSHVYRPPDSPAGTFVMGDAHYPDEGHLGNGIAIKAPGNREQKQPAVFGMDFDADGIFDEPEDGSFIAMNWLRWEDMAALMDWAGLRPMTEFEYVKAARGADQPAYPEQNAWNGDELVLIDEGLPTERFVAPSAIATHSDRPIRVGAAIQSGRTRSQSGVSYYGVADLSGNVSERMVSIGRAEGRAFDGRHGDGALDRSGLGNVSSWPGFDGLAISGRQGNGQRGGGYNYSLSQVAISNRYLATDPGVRRIYFFGFRAARSPNATVVAQERRCAASPLWADASVYSDPIGMPTKSGGPAESTIVRELMDGLLEVEFSEMEEWVGSETQNIQVRWRLKAPDDRNALFNVVAVVEFEGDGWAQLAGYYVNPEEARKRYHTRFSAPMEASSGTRRLSVQFQSMAGAEAPSLAFNIHKSTDAPGAGKLIIRDLKIWLAEEIRSTP